MDYTEDVERLFSWLKAPMVRYREFAPQAEVADAVATWPAMHRAAVQTGVTSADDPAPHGYTAVRERIARERMTRPEAAQRAIDSAPLVEPPPTEPTPEQPPGQPTSGQPTSGQPTPGRLSDRPDGGPLVTALGLPLQARHISEPAQPPDPAPPPAADIPPPRYDEPASPQLHSFEEPAGEQIAADTPLPSEAYAASDRGPLLGGEYRARERDARGGPGVADRHDRSLDAVFSRLSGGRDRLPDPRSRARTSPGLSGVFGRLR